MDKTHLNAWRAVPNTSRILNLYSIMKNDVHLSLKMVYNSTSLMKRKMGVRKLLFFGLAFINAVSISLGILFMYIVTALKLYVAAWTVDRYEHLYTIVMLTYLAQTTV